MYWKYVEVEFENAIQVKQHTVSKGNRYEGMRNGAIYKAPLWGRTFQNKLWMRTGEIK